jgi:hypothetical protein
MRRFARSPACCPQISNHKNKCTKQTKRTVRLSSFFAKTPDKAMIEPKSQESMQQTSNEEERRLTD